MHAVISWLLQIRKFRWYLLLTSSILLHDVIMTSYCYQRYAECLITTLCCSRTVHRHTALRTCNSWTAASRNASREVSCVNLWPPSSPDLSTVDYEIWAVMQHRVYHRQIWMNWNGGSSMSGAVLNSRFLTRLLTSGVEDIERVYKSVHDKGGHFKYSLMGWQCWFCPYLLHSMWLVWLLSLHLLWNHDSNVGQ